MNIKFYLQTDPISHTLPDSQSESRHKRSPTEVGSGYDRYRMKAGLQGKIIKFLKLMWNVLDNHN